MGKKLPDLKHEKELWEKGYEVIGIDEVGRGAFAGPLVVAGVIFPPTISGPSTSVRLHSLQALRESKRIKYLESLGINDSKKLKARQREMLAKVIQKEALASHISTIRVAQINRIGIGKATYCAMRDVVKSLRETLRLRSGQEPKNKIFVLIDRFYVKHMRGIGLKNQKGIVHGDCISLSIAAASIIAKVYRDKQMRKLSSKFKHYKWGQNKGYGTHDHRAAIEKFGKTKLHRTAFIKNVITSN